MAPPKLLILAGAPQASSLDWDPSGLLNSFQDPMASFFNLPREADQTGDSTPRAQEHAKWRSLSLSRPLHGAADRPQPEAEFFTTAAITIDSSNQDTTSLLTQFYETSLALRGEAVEDALLDSFSDATDSFTNATDSFPDGPPSVTHPVSPPTPVGAAPAPHLSDLEDVPPAPYLLSLLPRRVAVTLIAGVVSLAPPREVRTRAGAPVSLVEVLLGDDTRAGFSLTVWLSSARAAAAVRRLRPRDVVLVQNAGLGVFDGRVYGQSLRGGATRLFLLYRRGPGAPAGGGDAGAGHYSARDVAGTGPAHPQLEKTRRVWRWVQQFVGGVGEGRTSKLTSWDKPPKDTQ